MAEITYQMVLSTIQTAGLLVGIFYYVTTLRNAQKTRELTLQSQELTRKAQELSAETRQTQLFMNFNNQWTGGIRKQWNEIKHWEWKDYDDYIEKYGDLESQDQLLNVGSYFEAMGVYVKEGLVSIRLVALFSTTVLMQFNEMFSPIAKHERVLYNQPRIGVETDYLYNVLMNYHKEHPELLNP